MAEAQEVPPVIVDKPAKRRRTRNVERFVRATYAQELPDLLDESFKALKEKAKSGNVKAIEIVFQLAQLLKVPGGVNVVTQVNNRQEAAPNAEPGMPRGFESILRSLEARDEARALGTSTASRQLIEASSSTQVVEG